MRLLLLLIMLLCLLLPETHAVMKQAKANTLPGSTDSALVAKLTSLSLKEIQHITGRKMNFFERLQWKILQKKLIKIHGKENTSKDTISTISLISGIAGFVLLFLFPLGGFLLLLTAIITGIVGRKNNDNPKSAKKALIGLILGLAAIGLILIFAIAYSGGF